MNWGWQQPYDAALREKDPSRLPEQLVIAEKAILRRLRELPCPADDIPEGRALREALNRLYALYPHEHHPPGEIHDEETDPTQRNWMRFALPVGLGLTLASATAWMAARRNDLNDARRMAAAAEMKATRNSRSIVIPDRGVTSAGNAGALELGSLSGSNSSSRDPHGVASAHVAKPPEAQIESAQPRDSVRDPATVSTEPNPAAQAPQDSPSTSSASTEPQENSEPPQGTVSVSASGYPTIRVPPEFRSEANSSAESLQIGQSISRPDPVYPEQAEQEHIEGTVKLRAFVGKDGTVENVEVLSGPPLLASDAVDAVRQWRYEPTLLGNRPIEVAQDLTIVFRLFDASDAAH